MENQPELGSFDMRTLRNSLPQKKGLSRYYSGKSRSFTCMADVHYLEDLEKQEHADAKKRKKYADRKNIHYPPYHCRMLSNNGQFPTPRFGV